ncbi:cell wall-binding protein [Clostridium sp. 2-1]|uniref:PsbP-related protein n=1 Tax=Clostridium TaxID=1485 RepID=UPI000CDAB4C6|nr:MULTISPECIES: cell wall-binding protein [Clostridium]MBN7573660.1 cell wall-binding protein [Clostridium beijerinckii]MBN7578926.1 cell wall-binding protein [Clostridium beijerinckii]MBN7583291.1 cell wall-binding protein [Clostridium beijerinckii]MBO0521231.1 cell wall-binding protein [Clostridium beijerinckii]POO92904.1 cell wall-binding protein [Clostridium sp. 2-1]
MVKLKKLIAGSLIAVSVLAITPISASAEWKNDSTGWWYTEGGSYSTGWKKIEGKWYYFYASGYMAKNTVIDGYVLSNNGDWTGLETKSDKISVSYPSNWTKTTLKGADIYYLDNQGTNVNLVIDGMEGYSEEVYFNSAETYIKNRSDINNLQIKERKFNNNNVLTLNYSYNFKGMDVQVEQAIICNSNKAYLFTLMQRGKISDENMTSFESMLNTIKFAY